MAPTILEEYDIILERMKNNYNITKDNIDFLSETRQLLLKIHPLLQNDKLPNGPYLTNFIRAIDSTSSGLAGSSERRRRGGYSVPL
jgi:hypothetical protein